MAILLPTDRDNCRYTTIECLRYDKNFCAISVWVGWELLFIIFFHDSTSYRHCVNKVCWVGYSAQSYNSVPAPPEFCIRSRLTQLHRQKFCKQCLNFLLKSALKQKRILINTLFLCIVRPRKLQYGDFYG